MLMLTNISCFFVIIICILTGLFIYDRKLSKDKFKVVKAMWERIKDCEKHSYNPISQLKLSHDCNFDHDKFNIVIRALHNEGLVKTNNNRGLVYFTNKGINHYDFVTPSYKSK